MSYNIINDNCLRVLETQFLLIKNRLSEIRESDLIDKYFEDYSYTEHLSDIWGTECPLPIN
jgi:hypothetical protein